MSNVHRTYKKLTEIVAENGHTLKRHFDIIICMRDCKHVFVLCEHNSQTFGPIQLSSSVVLCLRVCSKAVGPDD